MAEAPWTSIPAGMIQAYRPVTGRLMSRLRRNQLAVINRLLTAPAQAGSASFSDVTWTVQDTIALYIPDCYVGPGGTRVELWLSVDAIGTPPPTPSTDGRVAVGSDKGTTVSTLSGNPQNGWSAVEFDPTPDTIVDLDLEGQHVSNGGTGSLFWNAFARGRIMALE